MRMATLQNQETTMAVNAFRPSDSDGGIIIEWFPMEAIHPFEVLI